MAHVLCELLSCVSKRINPLISRDFVTKTAVPQEKSTTAVNASCLLGRSRGESNGGNVREGVLDEAELRVVRPEVVAPGGHAVRLIDHKPSQHTLRGRGIAQQQRWQRERGRGVRVSAIVVTGRNQQALKTSKVLSTAGLGRTKPGKNQLLTPNGDNPLLRFALPSRFLFPS